MIGIGWTLKIFFVALSPQGSQPGSLPVSLKNLSMTKSIPA
jgi:hypothetical protein